MSATAHLLTSLVREDGFELRAADGQPLGHARRPRVEDAARPRRGLRPRHPPPPRIEDVPDGGQRLVDADDAAVPRLRSRLTARLHGEAEEAAALVRLPLHGPPVFAVSFTAFRARVESNPPECR